MKQLETVSNIGEGQIFISSEHERTKEKKKELINDNRKIHIENERLSSNLR